MEAGYRQSGHTLPWSRPKHGAAGLAQEFQELPVLESLILWILCYILQDFVDEARKKASYNLPTLPSITQCIVLKDGPFALLLAYRNAL